MEKGGEMGKEGARKGKREEKYRRGDVGGRGDRLHDGAKNRTHTPSGGTQAAPQLLPTMAKQRSRLRTGRHN